MSNNHSLHIISVGKLPSKFHLIIAEYQKMIRWQMKITEIEYYKKIPPSQIKQFEAKLIQQYWSSETYKILLDQRGNNISSEAFAKILNTRQPQGVDFIIGGAFGVDNSLWDLVNYKMSISAMTFSHQLAKIILLEQIYRAQAIILGHPYHK